MKYGFIEFTCERDTLASPSQVNGVENCAEVGEAQRTDNRMRDLDVDFLLETFAPNSTYSVNVPEIDHQYLSAMKSKQLEFATRLNPRGKTLMLLNVPAFLIPQNLLAFLGGCLRLVT